MTDNHTPEQRRKNMAKIRGEDTGPEKVVRSLLHKLGYRFRLHGRNLPGTPDLVFPSRQKVIFVHGCFWHMHECRKGKSSPATNAAFWQTKRQRTAARDDNALQALDALGWKAYTVWECTLKDLPTLQFQLEAFLSGKEAKASLAGKRLRMAGRR
jgi:DNA mismatch endonuclease (patch repair protein)